MGYFAELDATGRVLRVIVADSLAVCQRLTGRRGDGTARVWVETKLNDPTERYASIGDTYVADRAERFDARTREITR